jgi:hypothetical protein
VRAAARFQVVAARRAVAAELVPDDAARPADAAAALRDAAAA